MKQARTRRTIQSLAQNSVYDRPETGIIDGCAPSLSGQRDISVTEGWVRIDGQEFEFGGGTQPISEIPPSADPRIVVVVIADDGTGGVSLDTVSGDPEPLNDDLENIDNDFQRLRTPRPPDTAMNSIPVASVLVLPGESAINSGHWDDERVRATPKTTRTIVARPGEVQAALDFLSGRPGGTVQLDPDADYTTETGTSDQPWTFQNTALDGRYAVATTPSDTEPAIIMDPGLFGGLRNLWVDVPQSHDMESTSDERGVIDIDLDYFTPFSQYSTGADRYYPPMPVTQSVAVIGPNPEDVGSGADLARSPALRVREAGQGWGVCEINIYSQGMKHDLYLRGEGRENPNGGDRQGYLNGMWGTVMGHGSETHIKMENVGTRGVSKHQFVYYFQPGSGSIRPFEFTESTSINTRDLIQNWFRGHLWDSHYYSGYPDSLMLCDGGVHKNVVWNNTQINNLVKDINDGTVADPVERLNGAGDTNRFVDMQDIARGSLKHPGDFTYDSTGAVFGRDDGMGFNAAGGIPGSSDARVPEGIYPTISGGRHLTWGFDASDGAYREATPSVRRYEQVTSSMTLSQLRGDRWLVPVDSSGTGGITITIPDSHTTLQGAQLIVKDDSAAAAANPVTVVQESSDQGPVENGGVTLDSDNQALMLTSNGYKMLVTGEYNPSGTGGSVPDPITSDVDNVETASEQFILKDTGSGS